MAKKHEIKKSKKPIKKAKKALKKGLGNNKLFNKKNKLATKKTNTSLKDKNIEKSIEKPQNKESVKNKKVSIVSEKREELTKKSKALNEKIKKITQKPEIKKSVAVAVENKKNKVDKPLIEKKIKNNKIVKSKINKKRDVDYTTKTFRIASETIGFLKITEDQYGVRLSKGVTIKKYGELNYELRGKNPDGSDFGTIFDCVDKAESDKFFSELIGYLKTGDVEIVEEEIQEKDKPSEDSKHYNGIPIETKKMNDLIGILNDGHGKTDNIPVESNQTPVQSIQPPISETHTPSNTLNPTIPSQNPQLYYNEIQNKQEDNASNILSSMESYGNTILETINQSFQVRIQGTMSLNDFKTLINGCSKEFNYDVRHDGCGYFLEITKNEQKVRIPNNEYLKIN